jgi:UDP-N-acetyl-D-mannosaminuronic acid dehydrogenase
MVIVESTIAPGTIHNVVRPLLEEGTGRRAGEGFYLGACPERVMPGRLLANLRQMSRVCGGGTPETAEVMVTLYRHVVEGELDRADPLTAELVKTTENAYRDVQIAFANEVALICEAVGGDVWRVRQLVNKVPARQMHLPGAGVGGHCIPKDPWLLAYGAEGKAPVRLIPQARRVNDGMPLHLAERVLLALRARGVPPPTARVAVMGYAYLENSDDTRNSPTQALVEALHHEGVTVAIHDPWVPPHQGDIAAATAGADALVFMVAHQAYRHLDLGQLKAAMRGDLLIDGRHLFDRDHAEAAGFDYYCIGQGRPA